MPKVFVNSYALVVTAAFCWPSCGGEVENLCHGAQCANGTAGSQSWANENVGGNASGSPTGGLGGLGDSAGSSNAAGTGVPTTLPALTGTGGVPTGGTQSSVGGAPAAVTAPPAVGGGGPGGCNYSYCTQVILLSPLPADLLALRSLLVRFCFNSTCSETSMTGVTPNSDGGVNIPGASASTTNGETLSVQLFLDTNGVANPWPATSPYYLTALGLVLPSSTLLDGDLWSLSLIDAAGATYYTTQKTVNYELKTIQRGGDFLNCPAQICKNPITAAKSR